MHVMLHVVSEIFEILNSAIKDFIVAIAFLNNILPSPVFVIILLFCSTDISFYLTNFGFTIFSFSLNIH